MSLKTKRVYNVSKDVTTEKRVSRPPTNRKRKQTCHNQTSSSPEQGTIFFLHENRRHKIMKHNPISPWLFGLSYSPGRECRPNRQMEVRFVLILVNGNRYACLGMVLRTPAIFSRYTFLVDRTHTPRLSLKLWRQRSRCNSGPRLKLIIVLDGNYRQRKTVTSKT